MPTCEEVALIRRDILDGLARLEQLARNQAPEMERFSVAEIMGAVGQLASTVAKNSTE